MRKEIISMWIFCAGTSETPFPKTDMGIIDIRIPEFGTLLQVYNIPYIESFLTTDWFIFNLLGIPIENFVSNINEIRRQEERKMQILMSSGINLCKL